MIKRSLRRFTTTTTRGLSLAIARAGASVEGERRDGRKRVSFTRVHALSQRSYEVTPSGNQRPISCCADSTASEPWITLRPSSMQKSPRMVPGSEALWVVVEWREGVSQRRVAARDRKSTLAAERDRDKGGRNRTRPRVVPGRTEGWWRR